MTAARRRRLRRRRHGGKTGGGAGEGTKSPIRGKSRRARRHRRRPAETPRTDRIGIIPSGALAAGLADPTLPAAPAKADRRTGTPAFASRPARPAWRVAATIASDRSEPLRPTLDSARRRVHFWPQRRAGPPWDRSGAAVTEATDTAVPSRRCDGAE
jgi:hypothetical protein